MGLQLAEVTAAEDERAQRGRPQRQEPRHVHRIFIFLSVYGSLTIVPNAVSRLQHAFTCFVLSWAPYNCLQGHNGVIFEVRSVYTRYAGNVDREVQAMMLRERTLLQMAFCTELQHLYSESCWLTDMNQVCQ